MQILDLSIAEEAVRGVAAFLCKGIYKLIAWLYEAFMTIARVNLLSSDDIAPIYQRVTMILTIVMVFYVTFEFVKYVVQPDTIGDKEKGVGNIALKLVLVIVMIAFVPKIFSLGYKLQGRIIDTQFISKIVLGSPDIDDDMGSYGRGFSSDVFSVFYKVNEEACNDCDAVDVVNYNLNRLRENGDLRYLTMGLYESSKIDNPATGKKEEVATIDFDGLFAVVVGMVICYVLLLYCVDLGVRYAQLIFLQIISPIAIMGYLAPKKDNMFAKWGKQCFSTYINLFIRIVIIYFILLLCQTLNGAFTSGDLFKGLNVSDGIKDFTYIALILGLLMFASRAPKLLEELFPKGGASGIGFGFGTKDRPMVARAAGAALGATTGLRTMVKSGVATNRRARNIGGERRKENKESYKDAQNRYKKARTDLNNAKSNKDAAAIRAARQNLKYSKLERDSAKAKYKSEAYIPGASEIVSGVAGLVSGTARGAVGGSSLTKIESIGDIRKKMQEVEKNEDSKLQAYEKWKDAGGTNIVDRTAASLGNLVGVSRATQIAGQTKIIDDQIKARKAFSTIEADVKSKRDDVESRLNSKLEALELKNKVKIKTVVKTRKDENGKEITDPPYNTIEGMDEKLDVREGESVSDLYGRYAANETTAKSKLEAAINSGADDNTIKTMQHEYEEAHRIAIKVKKYAMRNAFTSMLQDESDSNNDKVAVEKLQTMKVTVETARSNSNIREQFVNITRDLATKATSESEKQKYEDQITAFLDPNNKYESYDQLDDIVIRLNNMANKLKNETMELEEEKRRIEGSDATAAAKANADYVGGGKK